MKSNFLITYRIHNGELWQFAPSHILTTKWEAVDVARGLAKSLGTSATIYINGRRIIL